MSYLMGIDLGTSSVKVIVIDEYGKILAQASEKYPILTPSPGWAEQDPDRWWLATRNAVRKALRSSNLERAEIKAIGFSGQMHGTVLLDRSLKPLRPAIIWADARSSRQCEEIRRKLG
ncbi:MAG: xylulokinase, partial [Thaumarchaeota archaeon]|nr:xylulokinase [Nitrososphaerota archaeon]